MYAWPLELVDTWIAQSWTSRQPGYLIRELAVGLSTLQELLLPQQLE